MSVYGKTKEPLNARKVTRDRNSSKSGPKYVLFRPGNKSSEKDHSFSVVVVVVVVFVVIVVAVFVVFVVIVAAVVVFVVVVAVVIVAAAVVIFVVVVVVGYFNSLSNRG